MSFEPFSNFQLPNERKSVVISRHWDNPEITITVNHDLITVVCSLRDFVEAVIAEVGDPQILAPVEALAPRSWWQRATNKPPTLSTESLGKRIRFAANSAIEKIKEATQ
jgi:hypothetical protein